MKKYIAILIKGILAGLAIGIGGWIFIKAKEATSSQVLASFLFSIGLILICNFGYFLYTGKICCFPEEFKHKNAKKYIIYLLLGFIGNYIGATLLGIVIRSVLNVPDFVDIMVTTKLMYKWWQLIVLGILCDILIYFAVDGFKNIENKIGKYVVLMMCVAGFIIAGFEHCVADMFYFAVSGTFTIESIGAILLIAIGNTIGGLIIPIIKGVFNE